MKVAVTGASGFVGQHVVEELLRRGIAPVVVTRSSRPRANSLLPLECVHLDVCRPPVDAFERIGQPELLIHLAWGTLDNYTSTSHFEDQLPAHFSFIKSLVESGLRHLFVSGTCAEYGVRQGLLSEEMDPRPVHAYGFAKDALRRQIGFLQRLHPFTLAWGRLFYLYGDGQASGSLFAQLSRAAERGDSEFPMSPGEQLRDYLPVSAAASLIVDLALSRVQTGAVNVCSGNPISIRRLVERWIQENQWNILPRLGAIDYLPHEAMAFWGDRRKLDSYLTSQ